jgi:hypothetical protein
VAGQAGGGLAARHPRPRHGCGRPGARRPLDPAAGHDDGLRRHPPARGRVGTPYQASHDLGVSAVYLHYLRHRPDDAACWVGEDNARAAGRGNKKPDAVVLDPGSGRRLAVEFGAGYPAARLRAFHRHCERHRLPYEVW